MLSHIPEDHQEDPGEIVEISTNPWQVDQVMIGYSAGFMMVWDLEGFLTHVQAGLLSR